METEHHRHARLPRNLENPLRRSAVEKPARLPLVQRRRKGRGQDDEGAPAVLASSTGTRSAAPAATRSAPATALRPWDDGSDSVENAQQRAQVAFEFIEKLGAPFYAFHDRDVAPEGKTLRPRATRTSTRSSRSSRKSSSGPASSCSGARPTCSATPATCTARRPACNADAFAFAAAQVKKAMEVTKELGGAGLRLLGRPRRLSEPAGTPT